MIELDPENRVSDRPADEANGGAIRLGGKTVCDPMVPADSAQVVGADQDKPDLPTRADDRVLSSAQTASGQSPLEAACRDHDAECPNTRSVIDLPVPLG